MLKKLLTVFIAVFMITTVAFSAILVEEAEEDNYLAAMDAYNKKDFSSAGMLLSGFLNDFPESKYKPNVLLKLAELEDDFGKKKEIYDEVLKNYTSSEHEAEATYSLGRLYFAKGDYDEAEKYFGRMLGKYSETVWVEPTYYYLILTLMGKEKNDEAINIYNDYSREDKYFMYKSRINLAYANILYRTKKYKKAIPLFKEIIDNSFDKEKYIYLPDVYKKLAQCYNRSNDALNAEKVFGDLRLRFPNSPEAKQGMKFDYDKNDAPDDKSVEDKDEDKVVEKPTAVPEKSETVIRGKEYIYTVQIGAFSSEKNAEILADKYRKKGYSVFIRQKGKLNLVQVGKFPTKPEAKDFADDFSVTERVKSFFVKKELE